MRWRRDGQSIRSDHGYVIERTGGQMTVYVCRAPGDKGYFGGVSGVGIDKSLAVAMCERHRERAQSC